MSIFCSESELQKWRSNALKKADGVSELIVNCEILDQFVPSNFAERKLLESFQTCLESLHITSTFSENENISLNEREGLKPDFILYAPETEGIVIVELKNIAGPTRQAGTELGAYASEIRTWIPFCADGDLVFVIISMHWPTLLKHFIRHEVFWQSKNIICLQPVSVGQDIKLEILPPQAIVEDIFSFKMCERHIGGFQICLYDDDLNSDKPNPTRLDNHVEQMKTALQAMSVQGNILNSHGFAFLWKDRWTQSLAPYSITTLNSAPFQSIERFLHVAGFESSGMLTRFIKLVREYDPEGHSNSLSKVTDAGRKMLVKVCSPRMVAFTHWGALKEIMMERGDLIAFVGWGIFGEAFFERLSQEYSAGNSSCSSTSPETGLKVLSEIIDESYQFIDLSYVHFGDEMEEVDSQGDDLD